MLLLPVLPVLPLLLKHKEACCGGRSRTTASCGPCLQAAGPESARAGFVTRRYPPQFPGQQ